MKRDFEAIKIGLELDRQEIYDRINKRVDIMIDRGLLDEVKEACISKRTKCASNRGLQRVFRSLCRRTRP